MSLNSEPIFTRAFLESVLGASSLSSTKKFFEGDDEKIYFQKENFVEFKKNIFAFAAFFSRAFAGLNLISCCAYFPVSFNAKFVKYADFFRFYRVKSRFGFLLPFE